MSGVRSPHLPPFWLTMVSILCVVFDKHGTSRRQRLGILRGRTAMFFKRAAFAAALLSSFCGASSAEAQVAACEAAANTGNALAPLPIYSEVCNLQSETRELSEGTAISLALETPLLQQHQSFAIRGGWGHFSGSDAFGFSAAGLAARNVIVDGGVGVGTQEGTFAGRGGVTIGW